MNIQFSDPFVRGWRRTKKALFQPFDLRKWFVVGFTAFLAALSDCNNGGNGSGVKKGWGDRHDLEDMIQFPHEAWRWLMENPGWFTLIIIGIFFLFIIGVLVTWVSARGKFMFLDNVIHDRALVVNPWNEYRKEGNSFFIWQFIFGIIVLVTIAAYLFMSYI